MKRIALAIFVAATALLLAGCFGSVDPVFPLSGAVPALGDGGRYATFERQDDGTFKPDDPMLVRKRTDGAYDFVNEKGEATPISFHPMAGGLHVGQAVTRSSKIRYAYIVVRIEGREVLIYAPDCEKQDRAKLLAAGVVIEGKYECLIDKVADPTAFFAGLTLGSPTSKMVRE